jgi:hypothetical protein
MTSSRGTAPTPATTSSSSSPAAPLQWVCKVRQLSQLSDFHSQVSWRAPGGGDDGALDEFFPSDQRATSLLLLSKHLIGVISQALLPGTDGWLKLVTEYFENEGATRKWIREGQYREMHDFLCRAENEHTRDLLAGLVTAYQAGLISAETARSAAPNPGDFDRSVRGIV